METVLSDRTDWKPWIQEIKEISMHGDVWIYIDPDVKKLPKFPDEPILPGRTVPTRIVVRDDGTEAVENMMTPAEWVTERYYFLEIYKIEYKKWEKRRQALMDVSKYMFEHLAVKNRVYIDEVTDVRERLVQLKNVFSMTARQERANRVQQCRDRIADI